MRTVTTVASLRHELAGARAGGQRIGLVPTMGAFHAGHLALMERARAECDVVVVSLFVNPAQFNDPGDLAAYPRGIERDAEQAAAVGVDVLFTPDAAEVYPDGFATTVSVSGITERLEGASRGRAHFTGVTTVVAKLFAIAGPDVAYFGQKDAQQVAVVRRMTADLNLDVEIVVCPTVRDPDGLALSSRNARLSPAERERALSLSRALSIAAAAVRDGERDPDAVSAHARTAIAAAGAELEYLELVTPDSLVPVAAIDGPVLAVIAARLGAIRLIDNALLAPLGASSCPSPTAVTGSR
jgi:pantoate--beta-alanine ligase